MNLNLLLLIPTVTVLAVFFTRTLAAARGITLFGSLLQLAAAVVLYIQFRDGNTVPANGYAFEQQYALVPALHINYHVGVDGISVAMILLTSLVVVAGVLVSWKMDKMPKEFFSLLILLSMGAYGFFLSLDLFVMFFFLELAVIPKYLLIGIWGSGKKEYSANKLALMLMGGSALVLIGILGLYFSGDGNYSFDILAISQRSIGREHQLTFFPLLFVGFGVFTALFPFHTWVPDGHSSAPTAGSMFLAGISMKLGGFGCLKVATLLLPEGARYYSDWIIVLSAIGVLYGSFATLMQKDLKYMNAYSSISHCGFVLLGIGMLTRTAITGAVMQMVSHGLMTALFFALIGMIYERTHTRMMNEMGGLLKVMPFISSVLFIAGLCSLGLPGLSGFVAEMTVFVGSWERTDWIARVGTIASCCSIVVTAVYILRAIGQVAMGPLKPGSEQLTDATWYEKGAMVLLVIAILAMGIMPSWLNDLLKPAVDQLSHKIAIP